MKFLRSELLLTLHRRIFFNFLIVSGGGKKKTSIIPISLIENYLTFVLIM